MPPTPPRLVNEPRRCARERMVPPALDRNSHSPLSPNFNPKGAPSLDRVSAELLVGMILFPVISVRAIGTVPLCCLSPLPVSASPLTVCSAVTDHFLYLFSGNGDDVAFPMG